MKPIKITNPSSSIKINEDQAIQLGIDINKDQIHGDLKNFWILEYSSKL